MDKLTGDCAQRSSKCQVDFQFAKNNKEHRTDEISTKRLIVRRGQIFNIKVNFTDGSNPEITTFRLIFETGPDPKKSNGTQVVVPFTKSINVKRWSGIISSSTSSEWCLAISPSPTAKIGYHRLTLQHIDDQHVKYYIGNFVVLFNPWCSEDEVFLNSDSQRDEYVMNETGIIYVGSSDYINHVAWNFGQFEEDILDICLKILDNTPLYLKNPSKALATRGYPVYIARLVSAMVNSSDDRGVLQGRWHSPYDKGVYPGIWNGSIAILRKWNNDGCRAVRYGQCWVFAGVACTGIPTRVVTNFDSAHDADANLTIDSYYDVEGDRTGESNDSIWNFHVWNECWMTRNDLRLGNDGWQVVDATPQEESDGIYCCGPAPVKAIKEGDMDMKYDVPFVFAEVNAHCVEWLVFGNGTKMRMDMNVSRVGHCTSTKRCGSDEREDVTGHYKYSDGSIQETEVFERANRIQNIPPPVKTLGLTLTAEKPIYNGKSVAITLVVSNKTSKKKVCELSFWAKKRKYHGPSENTCVKKHKQEITIAPNEEKIIPVKVDYKEYGRFPDMYNLMKLISLVTDVSTKDSAFAIKDVTLINPPLTIKVLNEPVVQFKNVLVEISFLNTFPETLKNCVMTLEGAGLIEGGKEIRFKDVAPNEATKVNCDFVPYKSGLKKLLVDFDCDKLQDVKGSLNITVKSR